MQDTYSLAYAMTRDGQGIFGSTSGAKGADIVNPGPLVPNSLEEAAPLSPMSVALTNAGVELSGLSLSLGVLRTSVDALEASLSGLTALGVDPPSSRPTALGVEPPMSRLNTVDIQSSRTEQKTSIELTSSTSEELRLTREALTFRDVQSLDPVAAFQRSNASLSFDAKATSEKSITERREESTKSAERLTKTLEPAPILGEDTWLRAKTHVLDATNEWVSQSPAAAETLKTTGAVMSSVVSPLVSELVSGVGDKIKDRVAGNLVDLTLGKLPGAAGKLFKEDGFEKDKTCCCNDATQRSPRSRRTARRSTPAGKKGTQKPKSQRPQKPRKPQKSLKPKNSQHSQKKQAPAAKLADAKLVPKKTGGASALLRGAWQKGVQSLFPAYSSGGNPGAPAKAPQAGGAQTKSRKNNSVPGQPPSGKGPGLNGAVERGLVPLSSEVRTKNLPLTQTVSHERSAAPVAHPPKIPGFGLLGTMSKLESSAARRLGPLKYVDTAMDVVQGVRNGDAKAVGAGLSSAGGAWAGASAGAAIGTLIFPGVGTAVGGAIGGLLGSEAGSWLSGKLFSATDRLPAPDAVSKELNSARTDSVQLTLAPSIQITGVNPADAQQVVNQVIQALQFQCMPMVTDALGMRRNAALADHGGD